MWHRGKNVVSIYLLALGAALKLHQDFCSLSVAKHVNQPWEFQGVGIYNLSAGRGIFKRFHLFICRERGREGEREGKKHLMWKRNIYWLPLTCPNWRPSLQPPGMCSDRESNQWPFSLQNDAQPTEPHQAGQEGALNMNKQSAFGIYYYYFFKS